MTSSYGQCQTLVLKQGLEKTLHLAFSTVSKMTHLREIIILALLVHNASLTPSMKFKPLIVENAKWDDMEISATLMHTENNQRSVLGHV